jgi:hypothetical protein
MPFRKKTLKVVPTPLVETVPTAPPALEVLTCGVRCENVRISNLKLFNDRSPVERLSVVRQWNRVELAINASDKCLITASDELRSRYQHGSRNTNRGD